MELTAVRRVRLTAPMRALEERRVRAAVRARCGRAVDRCEPARRLRADARRIAAAVVRAARAAQRVQRRAVPGKLPRWVGTDLRPAAVAPGAEVTHDRGRVRRVALVADL